MLRILIVDDEQQERDGLEKLILKNDFDLDIVKAVNGEEALDFLYNYEIDILLTDIKMPFLDGITLIDKIKNTHHDTFFILYSAYADFEYAQSAISLRVHRYLLKPISVKEFISVLKEGIKWCVSNKSKKMKEKKNLELLEESKHYLLKKEILQFLNSNEEVELSRIKELEPRFITNNFVPIIVCCNADVFFNSFNILSSRSLLDTQIKYILIEEDVFLVFLFVNKKSHRINIGQEFADSMLRLEHNRNSNIFLIIGELLEGINDLKQDFKVMYKYIGYQYFISHNTVFYMNKNSQIKHDSFPLSLYIEKIATLIEVRNFTEANQEIDKLEKLIQDSLSYNPVYIKYAFTEMIKKISRKNNIEVNLSDLATQIYSTEKIRKTIEVVKSVLYEMELKGQIGVRSNNRLIQDVKNLIFKEYHNLDLSLTFLAEKVKVTPAYLSSLFKTETGENLTSFITRYRIKQAKYLLKTTNRKVSDIGACVGYQNQSYFISIFRNKVNMTPSQYREKERE